jgi:hypothetical protein
MACLRPPSLNKIVNPDLARAALHGVEPYGEFKAYVRLAKPDRRPSYMKVMGLYAPDIFRARIRCDQIKNLAGDTNVISVELREHITSSDF